MIDVPPKVAGVLVVGEEGVVVVTGDVVTALALAGYTHPEELGSVVVIEAVPEKSQESWDWPFF